MDADLDLLLTSVFCTVDDLLPKKAGNAKRIDAARAGDLAVGSRIIRGPSGRDIERGLGIGSESRVSRLTSGLVAERLVEDRSDGSRAKRWHITSLGVHALA
jgi:hypothetical protein